MFKNRKNNKKGFTLVEVIVVLVILAILAAIMIPALTGWIDKANKKTAVVEGRTVLLALQTEASENYPNLKNDADFKTKAIHNDIEKLTDDNCTMENTTNIAVNGGKITAFTYVSTDGYTVNYADKKFTVGEKGTRVTTHTEPTN